MIRITDIQRFCMHDGPGVRTTVFFKGCPLRCAWCHNPETQPFEKQLLVYRDRCIGCNRCAACAQQVHTVDDGHRVERERCVGCGACAQMCPSKAIEQSGCDISVEDLLSEIQKDRAFYGQHGGVTFSGGECMMQIDALAEVLKRCREQGIHTAVDTSGAVPFDHFETILPYTELFLYDVKCFDAETHKRYVGVDNAHILDNLKRLLERGATVWVRIPIVPSVNDSAEEMQAIKAFLDASGTPQKVELLPYHAMGDSKYRALGLQPPSFDVPSEETMTTLRKVFARITKAE